MLAGWLPSGHTRSLHLTSGGWAGAAAPRPPALARLARWRSSERMPARHQGRGASGPLECRCTACSAPAAGLPTAPAQAGQLRVDSGTGKRWPGRLAMANAGSGGLFRCCRTCDSHPFPQPLLATACGLHPLHSPPKVETSVTPAGLTASAERRLEGRDDRQRPVGRQPGPLNQPAAYAVASWAAAVGACGGVQHAVPFTP